MVHAKTACTRAADLCLLCVGVFVHAQGLRTLASTPATADQLAQLLQLPDSKVLLAAAQAAAERLSAQLEGVRDTVVHEARHVEGAVVREAQELQRKVLKVSEM